MRIAASTPTINRELSLSFQSRIIIISAESFSSNGKFDHFMQQSANLHVVFKTQSCNVPAVWQLVSQGMQGKCTDLDKEEFQKTVTAYLGGADSSEKKCRRYYFHSSIFAQKFIQDLILGGFLYFARPMFKWHHCWHEGSALGLSYRFSSAYAHLGCRNRPHSHQ
jgi:hypothetical protein